MKRFYVLGFKAGCLCLDKSFLISVFYLFYCAMRPKEQNTTANAIIDHGKGTSLKAAITS